MTATLEQHRVVNCFTCGNPTGIIAPGGQCDFPVCGPCTNLHLPNGQVVNVPGNPRSFYCEDPFYRDDRITKRGGVCPVLPDGAYGGRNPDVEGEAGEGFRCGCGSAEFFMVERVRERRYHVTCNQDEDPDAPPGQPWVTSDCMDSEYDEREEAWAECALCGEEYYDFTEY